MLDEMTKIERAEKAILQLQFEGKLMDSFEITSMKVGNKTKALFVYGKAETAFDVIFYEWIEFGGKLIATIFCEKDGAGKYWDEEEGCIIPGTGLVEERREDLDVLLLKEKV